MRESLFHVYGILAVAALSVGTVRCGGAAKRLPNIILITSDALRADHLSIEGYPRATSPALDEFARKTWRFTDALTVIPKTAPSFTTIFTGRHPEEHGVRSNFHAVPGSLPMLAEILQSRGYKTAAFVGNPVLRETMGFTRGFETYELFDGRRNEGVRSVNEAFLRWADAQPWDRPTFVWIHYMDPHGPYTPPVEFERLFLDDEWAQSDQRLPPAPPQPPSGKPDKVLGAIPTYQVHEGEDRVAAYVARYDAEIRNMDTAFAAVLEFLVRHNIYDASAIVFTSDHGESLGEDNYYFEHGWFAHEPALRVPLMIKPPGRDDARTVETQVSNLDLFPTLIALSGAPPSDEARGADLMAPVGERAPLLIQNADEYPDKYYGIRGSGWKYLIRVNDGKEALYHLSEDRGERHNLAQTEPARLEELRKACTEALRATRGTALPQTPGRPDDRETIERLKSLGYVQ